MSGLYRYLPAITLAVLSAAPVHAAEKSLFTCTSGELVRRVVVEVGDLGTGLPCEVVYWKDQEAPGVRRVLWNARTDAAYCDGKASGLVDKLSTAGWTCDGGDPAAQAPAAQANASPARQPAAPTPEAPSTAVPALDAATAAGTGIPSEQPETQPESTAALGTAAQPQPAPPAPASPAPPAAPSTAAGTTDSQTAALPAAGTSDAAAAVDQLETVIQTNLSSLNQSVDGDFKAQIGDFGDLNNDGIDDAVVFFNYQSSTADFTQFVAAYLFNGESYHLAATKPVGGTDLAVRQVEVENIVEGLIQLRLVLNDAAQTEDKRAAMILKDGQLVETE